MQIIEANNEVAGAAAAAEDAIVSGRTTEAVTASARGHASAMLLLDLLGLPDQEAVIVYFDVLTVAAENSANTPVVQAAFSEKVAAAATETFSAGVSAEEVAAAQQIVHDAIIGACLS